MFRARQVTRYPKDVICPSLCQLLTGARPYFVAHLVNGATSPLLIFVLGYAARVQILCNSEHGSVFRHRDIGIKRRCRRWHGLGASDECGAGFVFRWPQETISASVDLLVASDLKRRRPLFHTAWEPKRQGGENSKIASGGSGAGDEGCGRSLAGGGDEESDDDGCHEEGVSRFMPIKHKNARNSVGVN
jgi:hypothetical protein